jgi:hypothetical protein
MFSCLNTTARENVLCRPMKTDIEDDFSSMAVSICFTVKLYEKDILPPSRRSPVGILCWIYIQQCDGYITEHFELKHTEVGTL